MAQDWWTGQGGPTPPPANDPHNLNIIPTIPVPPENEITLKINIGCTSRVRQSSEPFQPTISYTAPFLYVTDLQNYVTLIPTIAAQVYPYVLSEQQNGAIVETHVQIWLDNVTHPIPAVGVVKLPKGSLDTQLSNEEFTSAQVLQDHLSGVILNVKNTARY